MSKDKTKVLINQNSTIEWDPYLATAYAEGFCEGENAPIEEQIEAWAYLIKTGMCWNLQGWFGRNAENIIEANIVSKEGVINWNKINEEL